MANSPKQTFLGGPLQRFGSTNKSIKWNTHIVVLEKEGLGLGKFWLFS